MVSTVNGHLPSGTSTSNRTTNGKSANGHLTNGHHSPSGADGAAVAFTEARLSKGPSRHMLLYDSLPILNREKRQFDQFCQIDLAHLVMLVEQGILPKELGQKLFPVLLDIRAGGVDSIPFDLEKGSLLLQIEAVLAGRLGEDIAGRLHTGRSRIDQGATARRLFKRDGLLRVMNELVNLQETVVDVAKQHANDIMPTYTCLQQAQPGTFGHYLLSYAERLHDDFERCIGAFSRANKSTLGHVGRSGTSWPINRHRTAELLGFDGLVDNSYLAREAFYAAEILSTLSFVMSTLNDLATDFHLWSSSEFGLVTLDDGYCSTSSIFPQKKNPQTLEAIKYAAGPACNWLGSALSTFRGEGTGDSSIRSASILDDALVTTFNALDLMGGILSTVTVNKERMREVVMGGFSTTSNLADELVRLNGLSFREAHHVIARLVRLCEVNKVSREDVRADLLYQAARETLGHDIDINIPEQVIVSALDPEEFVRTRTSEGGVSPEQVEVMLSKNLERLAQNKMWLRAREEKLESSRDALDHAISAILS